MTRATAAKLSVGAVATKVQRAHRVSGFDDARPPRRVGRIRACMRPGVHGLFLADVACEEHAWPRTSVGINFL
jgi:hypothetical protein